MSRELKRIDRRLFYNVIINGRAPAMARDIGRKCSNAGSMMYHLLYIAGLPSMLTELISPYLLMHIVRQDISLHTQETVWSY